MINFKKGLIAEQLNIKLICFLLVQRFENGEKACVRTSGFVI